ncbi:hypothetical protein [Pseudomonas syringae group sp. J254-4]|uniref:hypothetical protein n=1 Tax=Pseudomonas syringae group sp. J254-4 TaxID=3079589 RepID=UPI002906DE33|nr:hypothetical protein [Pseudomonas syringae group sp. J254-4]MDU8458147.1 hypothetical protein [Pseudomonas syringae group sp. J254-4]
MKELGWQKDNPFMPDLKTAKDVEDYIAAGGLGVIEARIERAFSARFSELKEKISRLFDIELSDPFEANLLLTSILVDTRALFLESDRQKRNATLQNVYRARRMESRAAAVDAVFDEEFFPGKSLREVIKAWVDKRVVHMDWLWDDDEVILFKRMESLIFGGGMKNLLIVLVELITEYEEVVLRFGENMREQLDLIVRSMTGGTKE